MYFKILNRFLIIQIRKRPKSCFFGKKIVYKTEDEKTKINHSSEIARVGCPICASLLVWPRLFDLKQGVSNDKSYMMHIASTSSHVATDLGRPILMLRELDFSFGFGNLLGGSCLTQVCFFFLFSRCLFNQFSLVSFFICKMPTF